MKKIKPCLLALLILLIVTYVILMTRAMILFKNDYVIVPKKSAMQQEQQQRQQQYKYQQQSQEGVEIERGEKTQIKIVDDHDQTIDMDSHYHNDGQYQKQMDETQGITSMKIDGDDKKDPGQNVHAMVQNSREEDDAQGRYFHDKNTTNSDNMQEQQTQKQRQLQFLHIPKNAGSAVTDAAIRANVAWGYCRFQMGPHCPKLSHREDNVNDDQKDLLLEQTLSQIHKIKLNDTNKYLWHYPPSLVMDIFHQYLIIEVVDDNNSRDGGTTTKMTIADPYDGTDLFVVVRNPYDRIISAYYHWETMHHPVDKCNSAGLMNRLVGESLDAVKKDYYKYRGGHYIPQYDFVYDTTNINPNTDTHTVSITPENTKERKRVVKHIIRFENLKSDFEQLMKEYDLNVTLEDLGPIKRKRHKKATLTKNDLSDENRQRIEQFYAKDFEEFGYPIIPISS